MISLSDAVAVLLYLVIGGLVFGLLYWLICYCEKEFPQIPIFFKVARILLVILAVLCIIGTLLSMITGRPLFRQ